MLKNKTPEQAELDYFKYIFRKIQNPFISPNFAKAFEYLKIHDPAWLISEPRHREYLLYLAKKSKTL